MSHLAPRSPDDVPELGPFLAAAEAGMGFIPNSMLTMAHMPQLPAAFLLLATTVFGADLKATVQSFGELIPGQEDAAENLPPGLVQLIALASSLASGCRYCQAHTSHSAHKNGESDEKLAAILSYESSGLYSDAERAALTLAFAAGRVPNEAAHEHFARLEAHFSKRQIVQIVAVISLFGFLNRWNDSMATTLEALPTEFAEDLKAPLGWRLGKHA